MAWLCRCCPWAGWHGTGEAAGSLPAGDMLPASACGQGFRRCSSSPCSLQVKPLLPYKHHSKLQSTLTCRAASHSMAKPRQSASSSRPRSAAWAVHSSMVWWKARLYTCRAGRDRGELGHVCGRRVGGAGLRSQGLQVAPAAQQQHVARPWFQHAARLQWTYPTLLANTALPARPPAGPGAAWSNSLAPAHQVPNRHEAQTGTEAHLQALVQPPHLRLAQPVPLHQRLWRQVDVKQRVPADAQGGVLCVSAAAGLPGVLCGPWCGCCCPVLPIVTVCCRAGPRGGAVACPCCQLSRCAPAGGSCSAPAASCRAVLPAQRPQARRRRQGRPAGEAVQEGIRLGAAGAGKQVLPDLRGRLGADRCG